MPRRDDRAEPDDDSVSSSRIDVVNVDGGRSDTAATSMNSLRRELAKLHQQAAAVEQSLEDQRRDRSDSLDRLERATERVLMLEAKLSGAETESSSLRKMHEASLADLQTMRAERDDLALAVEAAKTATSELGKLTDEITQLRKKADEAAGVGGELAKAKEATAQALADAAQARAETAHARADVEKAKKALDVAEEDAAMVGDQASKIRAEAAEIRVAAEKAREDSRRRTRTWRRSARTQRKAREDAAKKDEEAAKAREEAAKAREEAAKAREEAAKNGDELAKAREELTRAKEDNSRDRATARDRIDLIERALDDAREANSRTESLLEAARGSEDRLGRQLEAANARAARAESQASAMSMAHATLDNNVRRLREEIAGAFARVVQDGAPSATSESPILSIPPEMVESLPPDPSRPPKGPPPPLPHHAAPKPSAAGATEEPPVTSSPASKSVPPPPNPSMAPVQASVPPPTYASVPPQLHASVPPAARGSIPPPYHEAADLTSRARQELLAKLVDPDHAEAAAAELRTHPEWLRSVPPPALVAALSSIDYDAEGSIFDLARAWDREPLCHSLIAALRSESDMRGREHSAWLLKHLAAPSSWKAIADLARSDDEPVQLRRWLLEALDRLAAGRAIGWRELGDVVTEVARHPDASLRDGVVGILVSLDRSDEKRLLLLDILRADDDEVVLASAVNALANVLPMELDPGLVERLLSHPEPAGATKRA